MVEYFVYFATFQKLPPVRNSLDKKKKKKKVKQKENGENGEQKKSKRINAYDFRSWDKFDVVSLGFESSYHNIY